MIPLLYIECDCPEGLTLREWRKGRSVPHTSPWGRYRARRRLYRELALWGVG